MKKLIFISAGVALLAVAAGVGCKATRAGYESAPYKVVRRDGAFEVRDYPALTLVETPMATKGEDGSFSRLFNFITGRNATKQKIAMTTPVFMTGSTTNATMAFVMPANMTAAQLPQPADASVTIREAKAGQFAVFRFSGGQNSKNAAAALSRLRTWMTEEKLSGGSEAIYGYFDPPWTPTFLRRNEVMLRVASDAHTNP
jgi:hypothetical protein